MPEMWVCFQVNKSGYVQIASHVRNAESDRRQAEWDTVQKGNEEAAALRQWQAPDGLRKEKDAELAAHAHQLNRLPAGCTNSLPAARPCKSRRYPRQSAKRNRSFRSVTTPSRIARSGSKVDFIFREWKDEIEFLSILFETKNETDSTSVKHKNKDFLKEPENVRKSLVSSERQLRPANDKADEPTIKKTNQECAVCPRPVGGNGRRRRKMRYPK